jgi:signal transduction histidine kinase
MTSGIAHDFRNLLTVIGSAIKITAMSSGQPERARACLAGLAAHREPSEAGEVGIDLYDVTAFLKKLEQLLKFAAGSDVSVVLELAPDFPNCVVDPSRFDIAILNLVANARDALSGAGEIQISTQLCSELVTS